MTSKKKKKYDSDIFITLLSEYANYADISCENEKARDLTRVRELRQAGLISGVKIGNITALDSITYTGRLELERLKAERKSKRWWIRLLKVVAAFLTYFLGFLLGAITPVLSKVIESKVIK
ncbi:MAG: hypothetical protein M0Q49_01960 [Porticoccaceae bacterium]|nr:hypothetical protein [Porticoccaceae bacterium]